MSRLPVARTFVSRTALLLALSIGTNALADIGGECPEEGDAGLVDACSLCPCCAASLTSPAPLLLSSLVEPPQKFRVPALPRVSLEAPAPPTPPPIS